MKRIKVRGRNGAVREEVEGYLLMDGESIMVPLEFMDAKPRMVTDSRGNPAGCRPGFLYADSDIDLAVKETIYAQYCADISQRWMSGRWSGSPKPAPSKASGSVDEAYAQYARDISERWQR
jgi:hypothetical protein